MKLRKYLCSWLSRVTLERHDGGGGSHVDAQNATLGKWVGFCGFLDHGHDRWN